MSRYSMRKTSLKILVATLLAGLVFFMGVELVSAATDETGTQATFLLSTAAKECSWDNIYECVQLVPVFLGYVLFLLTAAILLLVGGVFDTVLNLSIDTKFINKDFVHSVWIIVRDFSNMMFIFVLLYAGLQTMFGMGNWKKTVLRVVIIALLINFSLFFTKVVIDAGNILAVGIYKSMGVKTETKHTLPGVSSLEERELSVAIAAAVGPQKFLGAAGKPTSVFMISSIFIIGSIINLVVAWALLRAGIIFIGRIIGFWFLMVISPFAFISLTLPQLEHNFNEWLKNLLGLAFVAPVFLFFLYLIMTVLKGGGLFTTFTTQAPSDEFTFDMIFTPVIMTLFIYLAFEKAVKYSKEMSGSFGDAGATIAAGAMGVAGLGVGAVATLGTVTARTLNKIGGAGRNADGTDKTGGWNATARGLGAVGHAFRNSTFDVRNAKIPWASGKLGTTLGTGLVAAGLDAGKGRTHTLQSTKAEAIKHAEEKEKKKGEKRESVAVAVDNSQKRREQKKTREKEQKASLRSHDEVLAEGTPAIGIPGTPGYQPASPDYKAAKPRVVGLEEQLLDLEKKYKKLIEENGPEGKELENAVRDAKDAYKFASDDASRPDDPEVNATDAKIMRDAARVKYSEKRNLMEMAEKKLKDFNEGAKKIDDLKEKIEKYRAL